jgi:hypothetical protein
MKRSNHYQMRKQLEAIQKQAKEIETTLNQAKDPVYWSSSKGKYVKIADMHDEHILNAINKATKMDEVIIAMILELGKRGFTHLDILA